jgi:hypothetical protein
MEINIFCFMGKLIRMWERNSGPAKELWSHLFPEDTGGLNLPFWDVPVFS